MEFIEKEMFCNKDGQLSNAIPQFLIENVFGEPNKEELENRYNDMRNNYDCSYKDWQDRFTTKGRPFRNYSDTTSFCIPVADTLFPELIQYNTIGFDIPTWAGVEENKPIVMFVAQDPLRSYHWYKECKDIVASSPFGVQDATHRISRHGITYFTIFSAIVKAGYGIYLTDSIKFYLKGNSAEKYITDQLENYKSILKKEVDIVKPTIIVTFGRRAELFIETIVDQKIHLPLIHPSGASRGHIKNRYKIEDCSNKNIANEYIKMILEFIHQTR